jgi:hypothetical protein
MHVLEKPNASASFGEVRNEMNLICNSFMLDVTVFKINTRAMPQDLKKHWGAAQEPLAPLNSQLSLIS